MKTLPTIVAVGYNRVSSIKRLLTSLELANYGEFDKQVKLIVSIDYSGSNDLLEEVERFKWSHGTIEIIEHRENLGLRNHILKCGDLTNEHESIILLEDDIYVSPFFYQYVVKALSFYNNEDKIGGISLYSHSYNESSEFSFLPLADNSDVYFLQIASSWGQAWTKKQWSEFRKWYDKGQIVNEKDNLPSDVISWSDRSWKKFFIKYLVVKDKYFVYPKISYSTNFGDVGTHQELQNNLYQVSLVFEKKTLLFKNINDSISIYDSFCELSPLSYKIMNPKLRGFDFESDLYGLKDINKIKSDFILTSKESKTANKILSFSLNMKPIEMNIICNIDGDFFNLYKINENDRFIMKSIKLIYMYDYFYKPFNKKSLVLFFKKQFNKILKKVM